MSSALVKLLGNFGLFRLSSVHKSQVKSLPGDNFGIALAAGTVTNLKDGEEIEDGVVQANQTVLVVPEVPLTPHKFHTIVSYSSELGKRGAIVSPLCLLVGPGNGEKIGLVIRASKKIDLKELSHVFELYMID